MHILKIIDNGSPVYLMREKKFDILNLVKGFTVEFRQDATISSGCFSVNVPLFVTYLEQFQDFKKINDCITPLVIKSKPAR